MRLRGFSLVEVIIAVGVFAIGVVGILGLLPHLSRQSGETADRLTAQRLPDAIRVEMQRLAGGGFDAFAASLPQMDSALPGYALVAPREGTQVSAEADASELGREDAYFLIELWRFDSGSLAFSPKVSGAVAACVRVSWPYRRPGAPGATALADREQLAFATAIRR